MFTTGQTRTAKLANMAHSQSGGPSLPAQSMLLSVVLIALVALAVIVIHVRTGTRPAKLGWMSEQWLAEYRASHAS